jgi:hypothetical protein
MKAVEDSVYRARLASDKIRSLKVEIKKDDE